MESSGITYEMGGRQVPPNLYKGLRRLEVQVRTKDESLSLIAHLPCTPGSPMSFVNSCILNSTF